MRMPIGIEGLSNRNHAKPYNRKLNTKLEKAGRLAVTIYALAYKININ